jgi:mannose-1-phosphate guanylyltransferase/mannose-6-phosphate isomerase
MPGLLNCSDKKVVMKLYPVILSGGSGTRLWPLSREQYPKQLVQMTGDHSLFQQTLLRCRLLSDCSQQFELQPPIVVSNEQHRFLIAQQAQEIDQDLTTIILEPCGRNTAPALTLAAEFLRQYHEDGLMLVLPADHSMNEPLEFARAAIQLCGRLSSSRAIGVFGIRPEFAHTGYGYIEVGEPRPNGIHQVTSFKEKPDYQVAETYLAAGNYYWNSGMFICRASIWSEALSELNPAIQSAGQLAVSGARQDLDFLRVDNEAFVKSPSDSIDYAVIENIASLRKLNIEVEMMPLNCHWSDLGAWPNVAHSLPSDDRGNVTLGDVITEQTRNSFVFSQNRLVATVGVDDLVVVETSDAVLVADKSKAEEVKRVVEQLKQRGRSEYLVHRRVYRPWGNYETVDYGERYQVKRIVVKPGESLSLQMHHHRAEHWIVVRGTAEVTRGEETFLLSENESTYIPIGITHRLVNPGKLPLELIEVQSGAYIGEDDIVRFKDSYGRDKEQVTG